MPGAFAELRVPVSHRVKAEEIQDAEDLRAEADLGFKALDGGRWAACAHN
jgi:hypothetical protein